MSSGVNRVVVGSFIGTGAEIEISKVGFKPKAIELFNVDDNEEARWLEGMADASMWKRVTAGTASVATSNGITPTASGFKLGADSDLNADGELVRFVAYE